MASPSPFPLFRSLFWLVATSVLIDSGNAQVGGVVGLDDVLSGSGSQKMAALLQEVRRKQPMENPYVGEKELREFRDLLRSIDPRQKPVFYHSVLADYALEVAEQGRLEEAIRILEACRTWADQQKAPDDLKAQVAFNLGATYLRLAETNNCCARHAAESCILPLQGKAIHSDREGSEKAIGMFREVIRLTDEPRTRQICIWLLNLAHMTLGQYPDQVPAELRLPESYFRSEVDFPRFPNRAQELGLAGDSLAGGAVADDFDGDGDLDLVVSSYDAAARLRYLENRGAEGFRERGGEAGLGSALGGLNLIQGDYDNDGDLDLFVPRGAWLPGSRHPNSLLQNDGRGNFRDVTFEAGLGDTRYPTQAAAWGDYDNDGDLDLYIGNEHAEGTPAPSQLYRNNGDGTFSEVAGQAGVQNLRTAKGVAWGDFNGDGWLDLVVSNLGQGNRLYRNRGNGTFQDVAAEAGVEGPRISFPLWVWDLNNDGNLDLFVSTYVIEALIDFGQEEMKRVDEELPGVFLGDGKGRFENRARDLNLDVAMMTMGCNFGDLNNDGYLDFYLGTGNTSFYAVLPNRLYLNQDGHRFADISMAAGMAHLQKGHAVAFADFDEDGDVDVFEQLGGAVPVDAYRDAYFENPGFPGTRWIKIKLRGTQSNRMGVGARIQVQVRENGKLRSIFRHVGLGSSFGGNPLRQHIGLGTAEDIERIEVYWPASGKTSVLNQVKSNQTLTIEEG